MFAFGFFFIALGRVRPLFGDDDDLSPTEPDLMAPTDQRGFFPKLFDRIFGDHGDEAALKENEETVIKRKKVWRL